MGMRSRLRDSLYKISDNCCDLIRPGRSPCIPTRPPALPHSHHPTFAQAESIRFLAVAPRSAGDTCPQAGGAASFFDWAFQQA